MVLELHHFYELMKGCRLSAESLDLSLFTGKREKGRDLPSLLASLGTEGDYLTW